MNVVTIVLLIFLISVGSCIGLIAFLRKRPGLRRRRADPAYCGPARRFTDCGAEIEEAVAPVNNEKQVDSGDTMNASTEQSTQGTK